MFKVLNIKEWAISHTLLVGGLILLTLGLLLGVIGLTIAGIWVFASGLCFASMFIFGKLLAK